METEETVKYVFDLSDFAIRSILDLVIILILVGFIYYPKHKNKDFIFTFILFNIINFMICYLLGSTKIKMGFAFGLFAIFSIIRYRTIVVSIKDMGYFFMCVALGMLNSLASIKDSFLLLLICNSVIVGLTYILENLNFLKNENCKEIIYDRVDLIKPEHRDDLIEDLTNRIGLPIHKVDVISLNYLKDTALLKAYFYAKESDNILPTSMDND